MAAVVSAATSLLELDNEEAERLASDEIEFCRRHT